ncbi:aldo/keto reductase [Candidatus Poribacteria bacterium]|nr:aldo/keto reductase [Candidatus Poribacteria bacterium]
MQYAKLNSGANMPMVGIGTWTLKGDKCRESVRKALEVGYIHIDTAEAYDNQEQVALGIKDSGVERDKIFITSKVWKTNLRYDDTLEACDNTLKELQTDYLDLYLIHWPNDEIPMKETFRALTKLKDDGKVKDIGVSNFTIQHLEEAMSVTETAISVDQVKYHPYDNPNDLLEYCNENNIVVTAYSPFGKGDLFSDEELNKIAESHDKSLAQIILKWLIQKDIVVIPRSSSKDHLKANLDLFDWEISDDVVQKLENLT